MKHFLFFYKKYMALLLCLTLIITCVGCSAGEDIVVADETNDNIEIGITFDSLVIERWERDRDVFVSSARELGADVNVQIANGDVDTQISQIEYFIEKKVQAIVIVATDCDALSGVIARAHRAGIKVISYDRLISDANTDLYITFDNEMVGRLMGEAIVSHTDSGSRVLMVCGPLTDTNVPAVVEGFRDATDGNGIDIAGTYNCAGWRAEYAFDYVSRYIREHPDEIPDAIMCGNDSLAGQAIKALSERKLAGSVIVTGQDADLDACQRIVEGTQYMTVYKPVEKLAQRAAYLTVELASKGYFDETDEVSEIIYDGTYEIPYVSLEPIEVTKDNMDEVIIGSFHQRSEVYLNVDPNIE